MGKAKNPFFSLAAHGSIGRLLSARRHRKDTIIEDRPIPKDAQTSPQLAWRTMYQACAGLWHTLSPAEQYAWESNARSRAMSGFAYYMSQCLRPNPGIYLPLAGGTMSGDIAMASNKLSGLSSPTTNEEPLRKADWLTSLFPITQGALLLGQGPASPPLEISGWQTVAEITVPADCTYVEFTSLDINTDKAYIVFLVLKNASASGSAYQLFINSVYTTTNYYMQRIEATGTTIVATRENNAIITSVAGTLQAAGLTFLYLTPDLYLQATAFSSRYVSSSVIFSTRAITSTFTAPNIVAIRIQASAADAIAQNSTFVLCKPRTS